MDSLFLAIGNLFASGLGVMILALAATAAVLIAHWRLALIAAVLALLAMSTFLAPLHHVSSAVIGAQWLVTLLCGAILWIAGSAIREDALAYSSGTWLLRFLALLFLAGVWWFVDPGLALPLFTQVETDLLIWFALCGLAMAALTGSPLFTGIGLMLIGSLTQALAGVLASGPGLSLAVAVAEICAVLACGYLALAAAVSEVQGDDVPAMRPANGAVRRSAPRTAARLHPLAALTRRVAPPAARPATLPAPVPASAVAVALPVALPVAPPAALPAAPPAAPPTVEPSMPPDAPALALAQSEPANSAAAGGAEPSGGEAPAASQDLDRISPPWEDEP